MRKKSHISLARYIMQDMQVPVMVHHKKAFYLGSILPDCKPSFLTQRHEFAGTFDMVKERIRTLSEDCDLMLDNGRAFMRRLGEIIHYIADYFTFPHNKIYSGSLKDHCIYEKELKFRLRAYVQSGEAFRERIDARMFATSEDICSFIRRAHEEYLEMKHGIEEDCEYIVRICHQVVQAILNLVNLAAARELERRLCPA